MDEKKYPEESEGLGWFRLSARVKGVNDEWAELVEGFVPTRYELGLLARHYCDRAYDHDRDMYTNEFVSTPRMHFSCFARRRMARVRSVLGKEGFEAEVADIDAKWEKEMCRLHYKREDSSMRCRRCGHMLAYADTIRDLSDVNRGRRDKLGGLCETCYREVAWPRQPEGPDYESCEDTGE